MEGSHIRYISDAIVGHLPNHRADLLRRVARGSVCSEFERKRPIISAQYECLIGG